MSRYYNPSPKENPANKPPHPVWRGIGCALIVIIPIVSFFAAGFFVNNSYLYSWVVIPQEMIIELFNDPLILVKLLYTAIFVAILYLILTVITFILNRFFGPSRYGPNDVPLDKVTKGR